MATSGQRKGCGKLMRDVESRLGEREMGRFSCRGPLGDVPFRQLMLHGSASRRSFPLLLLHFTAWFSHSLLTFFRFSLRLSVAMMIPIPLIRVTAALHHDVSRCDGTQTHTLLKLKHSRPFPVCDRLAEMRVKPSNSLGALVPSDC